MIIVIKLTSGAVPLGEIVFFRSAFALVPLVLFLWVRGEFPAGLRTQRPWIHGAPLSVAEATLISYLSPVLLVVAAVILLGERLTLSRLGGLIFGFASVVVLVWPEVSTLHSQDQFEGQRLIGMAPGLAAALLAALLLSSPAS